jgi:hypothetical protein
MSVRHAWASTQGQELACGRLLKANVSGTTVAQQGAEDQLGRFVLGKYHGCLHYPRCHSLAAPEIGAWRRSDSIRSIGFEKDLE